MPPPPAQMRLLSKAFSAYTRSFERSPYITLLVANGLLMSIGDLSAQTLGAFVSPLALPAATELTLLPQNDISAAPLAYDLTRTARFAIFGASMGPLAGAWNSKLMPLLENELTLRPFSALRIPRAQVPPSTL